MSVICRTFVQNAWRSDLCSNCFKSLEDHHPDGTRRNVCDKLSLPRYVPQAATLYQSRGISTSLKWRLNESLYDRVSRRDIASQTPISKTIVEPLSTRNGRGILIKTDSAEKKYRSRPSVDFSSEEALVIGYGGNDYDSDTSPWEMGSDDDGSIDLDLLDDTDEDRKITRLTRNNTEFNSFNKNLLLVSSNNNSNEADSPRKVRTEEEDKINAINNRNNNNKNPVKSTDKAITILTYNDIQSTSIKPPEKKQLNQYFFPSGTDIKSYLNGRGSSLVIEEALAKNSRAPVQKVQNSEKKVNSSLDDFSPLNTRTYSFVSELDKSCGNPEEQSSDSDYSTCRHTTTGGDSTDSESLEESRPPPPKSSPSSFLHGTYAMSSQNPPESDVDKKYDAGSSTSGDVSNFSDDSDATFEPRTAPKSETCPVEQRDCHRDVQEVRRRDEEHQTQQRESPKTTPSGTQQSSNQTARQSPPSTKHSTSTSDNSRRRDEQKRDEEQQMISQRESQKITQLSPQKGNGQISRHSPPSTKHGNSSSPTADKNIDGRKSENEFDVSPKVTRNSPQNAKKDAWTPPKAVAKSFPSSSVQKQYSIPAEAKGSPVTRSGDVQDQDGLRPTSETSSRCSDENLSENSIDPSKELRDKEFNDYDEQQPTSSDCERSPDAIVDRQSKLAALALELELARRDSEAAAKKSATSPPPEVKARYGVSQSSTVVPASPLENNNYPTIKKASSAISCASRLSSSTLPDVLLQETTSPAKQPKKTKFSLKKLLKRNKDSGTFSPAVSNNKEVNPKAWKKQTFDRNRLSLEIVHPMDLPGGDVAATTSADSTPTEDHRRIVSTHPAKFTFRGVSSRARSLSALPQLSGDDQSGCALIDCRKMDTVPARKAGTVAERKKNRPSLVRTPSCSALPNRSSSQQTTSDRTPPPKPPPPPSKCKATHPPPPPPPPNTHPRSGGKSTNASPARPPPPKVPDPKSRSHSSGSSAQELHEQNHSDKEYANLGDIRSLLTPKKPQRPSAFSVSPREGEMGPGKGGGEGIYETLPPTVEEEEDHYTYLDEAEAKMSRGTASRGGDNRTPKVGRGEGVPPCGRPWLDLQTSYAAIAAANYESLAELITASLNESAEYLRRMEQSLKWRDFVLEPEGEDCQLIQDKAVYSAAYKNESQDKVTLVVAPRKHSTTPQNGTRHQTRYPVLASFHDSVPKVRVGVDNYVLQDSYEPASVYVLQRSRVTTVRDFAEASTSSCSDPANQSLHLRDCCFVLLQLIHALKALQAEGVEEIHYGDLQLLVLVSSAEEEGRPPVLVLFPEDRARLVLCGDDGRKRTLCQATLDAMLHFLRVSCADDLLRTPCVANGGEQPLAERVAHTFRAVARVLAEEKASSLSQAKGFLEYMLWGPVDVLETSRQEDSEDTVLQRWLDLQRAQMVKSCVSQLRGAGAGRHLRATSCLHVYEEYQLVFLLQASVKSLKNVISRL